VIIWPLSNYYKMTEKVSSLLTQSGRRPIWDTCSQWSCALARRHNLVVFFLREARLILSVRRAFIGFVKFEEPDDHWTPNMQRHLYSLKLLWHHILVDSCNAVLAGWVGHWQAPEGCQSIRHTVNSSQLFLNDEMAVYWWLQLLAYIWHT